MVPIEKIKEKKFYLGTKKGKVHVITNTVVDMQKAILGTALTSVRKIKKEAEQTYKFKRNARNELVKEVSFTDNDSLDQLMGNDIFKTWDSSMLKKIVPSSPTIVKSVKD